MNNLGHIEPTIEKLKGFDYFCTITLPKRYYRRRPLAQYKVMDNMMKHIATNYIEEAYGCYELTQKGNIHSHWIVKPAENYLNDNPRITVSLMSALLKQYSNCDFQLIKDKVKTLQYIYKDKGETMKVLEGLSPSRSITKSIKYVKPLSNIMEEDGCPMICGCSKCKMYYKVLDDNGNIKKVLYGNSESEDIYN